MEILEKYMQRALELAALGLGKVSPNPLVGCVIVKDQLMVGEGWHRQYGGPHAEVHAIGSVKDPGLLAGSTLFVNLEPCAHYGKTPPCSQLIIKSKIKHVVIANHDPNPLVAGKGLKELREAGIEVTVGVLEAPGRHLNRRFFTFHQRRRPYLMLKWAQTTDGYMAREDFNSKWISNEWSRKLVHQFRAQEDAIMVGRGTAHYDDPQLTVRKWLGRDPIRIVLDPKLTLSGDLKLFDGTTSTICYNFNQNLDGRNITWVKLPPERFLESIWEDLYNRDIQSVLVEGGGTLLKDVILGNYWDEARVFVAPHKFGKGIKAPEIPISCHYQRMISDDQLKTYYNNGLWLNK